MSNRFSAGILPPQRHRPKAEHATERASSASAQRGAHSLYGLTESPLSQELPILGRTDFRFVILVIRGTKWFCFAMPAPLVGQILLEICIQIIYALC